MNYQKLDSQLAAECEKAGVGEERRLAVFVRVRTPLPAEALGELQRLGAEPDPANAILSMDLPAGEVAALSDRPWVVSIRSSRKLRPLS